MPRKPTSAPDKRQPEDTVELTRDGDQLRCVKCGGRDLVVDRIYVNLPHDRLLVGFQADPLSIEHVDPSKGGAWLALVVKCRSCGEDIDLELQDGEARIDDDAEAVRVRWHRV